MFVSDRVWLVILATFNCSFCTQSRCFTIVVIFETVNNMHREPLLKMYHCRSAVPKVLAYFITKSTAKIQIKILGLTFQLTCGAIVNAESSYAGS